jgi:hypothetical protein
MALNAPLHLQRRNLRDKRHLIDAPVACCATYALIDMDRVIEINVVRKIVNARPFDRDAGFPAITDGFEIGRRSKKLRVAIHARFRRRHSGARGAFDRSMAIAAINAIVANVMLMAELNGLGFDDIGLIPIRRARQPEKNVVDGERSDSTRSHERYARYRVRALLKNLRHLLGFDVRISSETGRRMMGSYAGERAATNEDDRPTKKPFRAFTGQCHSWLFVLFTTKIINKWSAPVKIVFLFSVPGAMHRS